MFYKQLQLKGVERKQKKNYNKKKGVPLPTPQYQ